MEVEEEERPVEKGRHEEGVTATKHESSTTELQIPSDIPSASGLNMWISSGHCCYLTFLVVMIGLQSKHSSKPKNHKGKHRKLGIIRYNQPKTLSTKHETTTTEQKLRYIQPKTLQNLTNTKLRNPPRTILPPCTNYHSTPHHNASNLHCIETLYKIHPNNPLQNLANTKLRSPP
eukprot:NODE_5197_length_1051_cov_63.578664_g4638_i0.p1 GENE.NODE_5197_length_1051_cov_63.578664_g4638_i0~~NODE_5197_length_1051_cov_63.578664_g4638_i0.p1  ORF type:complete len:175 (+),score=17.33 NODE_5197_length_1051_cov_63.578664_g4638_i0:132-656(+)